jgi:uncharacterized protein YdhG (YjbR/CyaY superfamily)
MVFCKTKIKYNNSEDFEKQKRSLIHVGTKKEHENLNLQNAFCNVT